MGLFLGFWLVCAVLSSGITFAYYQDQYPIQAKEHIREDLATGVFIGLAGPIGLIMSFLLSGFAKHGIRWTYREPKGE